MGKTRRILYLGKEYNHPYALSQAIGINSGTLYRFIKRFGVFYKEVIVLEYPHPATPEALLKATHPKEGRVALRKKNGAFKVYYNKENQRYDLVYAE